MCPNSYCHQDCSLNYVDSILWGVWPSSPGFAKLLLKTSELHGHDAIAISPPLYINFLCYIFNGLNICHNDLRGQRFTWTHSFRGFSLCSNVSIMLRQGRRLQSWPWYAGRTEHYSAGHKQRNLITSWTQITKLNLNWHLWLSGRGGDNSFAFL